MRWNLIQRMLAPFVRVCFLAFCNLAYATTQLVVSISSFSLILNILDNKYTSFFVTQSAYQRENEEPNQREQKKTAARTQKANQPASKQANKHTNIPFLLSHKIYTNIPMNTHCVSYIFDFVCTWSKLFCHQSFCYNHQNFKHCQSTFTCNRLHASVRCSFLLIFRFFFLLFSMFQKQKFD